MRRTTLIVFFTSLVFTLFSFSVLYNSFKTDDYQAYIKPYLIAEQTGLSSPQAEAIFKDVVKFLYDDRSTLDTKNPDNSRPFFNTKENKHMIEVKGIFRNILSLFFFSLLTTLISLFFLFKKRWLSKMTLRRGALVSYFIPLLIAITLGLLIALDFNASFTLFHKLAFNNNDWLFDPTTDHLIQLLPEDFFMKRAIDILVGYLVLTTFPLIVTLVFTYQKK